MKNNLQPQFTPIDQSTWVRREYFHYYFEQIKCKYNLNANIDISNLITSVRRLELRFFPTFMYCIMRAVNQNVEFRMSFNDDGVLGTWNYLKPSYTIFHEDDKTFSDIWSEYSENFGEFYDHICNDMQTYKDVKGIRTREDKPSNFCPISALPWLSFSSFAQDTYTESKMLFPLIKFGKYYTDTQKTMIPLAVFVHHAVADGYHTCKLINDVQDVANRVEEWIGIEK